MSLFTSGASNFGQHIQIYPGALRQNALTSRESGAAPESAPQDLFSAGPSTLPVAGESRTTEAPPLGATPTTTAAPSAVSALAQGALLLEEPQAVGESAPEPSSPMIAEYGRAGSVDEVAARAAQLPQIARSLVMKDVTSVFGSSPGRMADRYHIDLEANPKLVKTMEATHAFAYTALDDLAGKMLRYTAGGSYHNLDAQRLSEDRFGDAVSQHVAYLAGEISRESTIKMQPGREISRVVLRNFFSGTQNETVGDAERDPKALMLSELCAAATQNADTKEAREARDAITAFVEKNSASFSKEKMSSPPGLLLNLASYHAGDAVLQFASRLMDGDDRRGEAFVKYVFSRPVQELNQMLTDPQDLSGMLVNFAAVAINQSWEWGKLGLASVAAKEGNPEALALWNHKKIGPSLDALAGDKVAAMKVAEQVEAFLLRDGKLVPCERGIEQGKRPLQTLLQHVETHGIYSGETLRVVDQGAVEVKERLWNEVTKLANLKDWAAGNEMAGDIVAHTCASFAAQAVKADFQEKENLVTLYRDAIGRFQPQLPKLLASKPNKKDPAYQAFFQELAGEFGFEALKAHMGTGAAHDLVRNASIAHIVPIACDALRLAPQKDYTPQQVVADIVELEKTLLKGDYFLTQPGFIDELKAEAQKSAVPVDRKALENGIRVPNAVWMWTQLTRGLVEDKPARYTGSNADPHSDVFPSSVQFSPPDLRDVELFTWAQHRLSQHGYAPKDATRMAMSLVVLTQYKDLLQMRKAA